VLVTLLRDVQRDGDVVEFRFAGGHGVATWKGDRAQRAHVPVEVELDTSGVIAWSEVTLEPEAGPLLEIQEGGFRCRAPIEDIEANGLLVLRLGPGLLSVEVTGPPPDVTLGQAVSFVLWHLELYPTGT